jgi:hypothetical protein
MKKFTLLGLALAVLAPAALQAQDKPKQPTPKAYRLLHQLVGEWEYDSEAILDPGKPPVKSKGTETVRAVGEFWVIAENKGTAFDMPFTGVMTLGYSPEKKKYVGTWIDSMNSHMLSLEGAVNEPGSALTLLTEGPNPSAPGKLSKFKDVIELKGKDHKVLTSSVQLDDGKWVAFLTVNYRRKK